MNNVFRILNIELLPTNKIKWHLLTNKREKFSYITDLPFKDYFFITEIMIPQLKELYPDIEFEIQSTDYVFVEYKDHLKTVYKVEVNSPYIKSNIRIKMEETYNSLISEGDISYIDLMMKDLNLKAYVKFENGMPIGVEQPDNFPKLRRCFYDIETDDRKFIIQSSKLESFAKPDVCRIISASICDAETGEIVHFSHTNEKLLIKRIEQELDKYDIIEAWNGNDFDFIFFKRFENYDYNKFILLDSMRIHEMLNAKERNYVSLDMAGQRYLNLSKIKHKWSFYEAFEKYKDELKIYNNRDVELMYKLEEKFGFSSIVLQTAEKIGFLPQKYTYSRYSSIQAVMKVSLNHFGKRFVWKSKSQVPLDEAYEGATVFDSIRGIWNNVLGIDLASLYNNIIQTWNISPEQLVITPDSHNYNRYDQEGIMPSVLRMFEIDRNKYKKLRNETTDENLYKLYDQIQAGLKIVLLSIYGGLGARGSNIAKADGSVSGAKSFYCWHCANDTTLYARKIIHLAKDVVEDMGYTVVYGDTDSLYINVDKTNDTEYTLNDIKKIFINIVDEINKNYKVMLNEYDIPSKRQRITMEEQGWYSPFVLFGKKKMYFARERYNAENRKLNDDLVIYAKGVKFIKLSEPQFIRDFQKEIYTMILNGNSLQQVLLYRDKTMQKFMDGEFNDKLIFETKISKKISDYKNKPVHIVLAEKLINEGKLQEKSTLFYTIQYTQMGTPIAGLEGCKIHPSGLDYMWKHRVKPWLDEILELAFYEQMQTTLGMWF